MRLPGAIAERRLTEGKSCRRYEIASQLSAVVWQKDAIEAQPLDRVAPLADNMTTFYEPCYRAYAADPTLYRIVLGQIYNGPSSVHAEENDAIRIAILGHMGDIIHHAMATGECRTDIDVALQSRSFFYVYFTAVRVWLFQDRPDPAQGLSTLHVFFETLIRGCAAGT